MKSLKVLLLSGLLIFTLAKAQSFFQTPPGLSGSCTDFLKKLDQAGWDYRWISVPQDWDQPVGPNNPEMKVFFYFGGNKNQNAQPLFFLNGGPITSYQNRWEALNQQILKYDGQKRYVFVMMDQRGVGCSVPNLPTDPLATPKILAHYGSEGIARDVEAIRLKEWPDRKINLFAQSYGGFLALRYLHLYPQNIGQIDLHGPTIYPQMKDFFRDRILRQNQILPSFFEKYKSLKLERALEIIQQPDPTKRLCLPATAVAVEVCGRPLVDGLLAVLGQGPGSEVGATEVYDGVRDSLLLLINDQIPEFLKKAEAGLANFRGLSGLANQVIWSQDTRYFDGSQRSECAAAYADLRESHHLRKEDLLLDECRLIETRPPQVDAAVLKEFTPGRNLLSHQDALATLERYPQIRFNLYTSELDFFSQVWHLKAFLQSPRIHSHHLPNSGHRGWLFEPVIWHQMMGQ